VNESRRAIAINLSPQPHDLHVDHVIEGSHALRLLPDIALEHFARHDLALVAQQIFQHVDFARRERDFLAAAHRRAGACVELEVIAFQNAARGPHRPAQQRAAAGQQFGEREGFREIIVRTAVEADDAVIERVARGQHQDRRVHAALPDMPEDFDAVTIRQHPVEHDQIKCFSVEGADGVGAGAGRFHVPSLQAQPFGERIPGLGFVLDDKDARWAGSFYGRSSHERNTVGETARSGP
jgi:hypothetical protein